MVCKMLTNVYIGSLGPFKNVYKKKLIFHFFTFLQRVIRRESKTDSYSKDLLFLACGASCVITFEPIMI